MLPAILMPLLSQGFNLISNAVLSKGKDWVKEKTGVDIDKASLSQEDCLKLKQYELDHEEELIRLRQEDDKLSFEIDKAYLQDTQDARDMQKVAMNQDDVFVKRFIYYFAIFWCLAACLYVGFITFSEIPKDNIRFADTIIGFILGTVVAQIIAFFYGSSKSSQNKDAMIQDVVNSTRRN